MPSSTQSPTTPSEQSSGKEELITAVVNSPIDTPENPNETVEYQVDNIEGLEKEIIKLLNSYPSSHIKVVQDVTYTIDLLIS